MEKASNKGTPKIKNSEAGGLIAGIILIMISFIVSVMPFIFSWDMMQSGYGTICIGLFIFIAGSITFLMYIFRYLRLRAILRGENVIVHWVYSHEKFIKEAKIGLEKTKSENKIKLGIIWFFFVLFTVIFLIIGFSSGEEDAMGPFFLMMLSIALLITAVAFVAPYLMYRQAVRSSPDAIIASNGMYYMGQLHTWNRPLFLIDDLQIDNSKDELVFKIKYFTKIGWYKYESYLVNIPIPEGEMHKAKEVVKKLSPV